MADLQDVEEILEGGRLHRPVDREVLATAIQALLFHQVIYEDLDRIGHRAYDALKAHRGFFERYFAAMGYRFVHSAREQMFALVADGPQYGSAKARLKKDETLIMLALRLLLENGMRAGTMDGLGRHHRRPARQPAHDRVERGAIRGAAGRNPEGSAASRRRQPGREGHGGKEPPPHRAAGYRRAGVRQLCREGHHLA